MKVSFTFEPFSQRIFNFYFAFVVFKSKYSEMDWVVKRSGGSNQEGFQQNSNNGPQEESVVRLRGLPFDSTKMDIVKFFDGKFHHSFYPCIFKVKIFGPFCQTLVHSDPF